MNLSSLKNLPFRSKLSIVTITALVFGIFGIVAISQQQQEIRSRAAGDITGDYPGDLVGDDFRVDGAVLGNIKGNRNQVTKGVRGGIYGDANSIIGNVDGCINGNNNRISGSVVGGVVGTNNIVTGTKGAGDCPVPGSPTATPTPTPTLLPSTPTQTPTPTPTRLPTPTPTRIPTLTPTVTPIPISNSTKISLNLLLHGLGKAGDSANPGSGGNPNPLRPVRAVTVEVFNAQNQLVLTKQGNVSFIPNTGNFTGTVDLGTTLQSAPYTVKVKMSQFLKALVPGIQSITQGTNNSLPQVTLINGDIDSNNQLNILDYNILIGCYSDFLPPVSCSAANKPLTDLDDDGNVNQFDYNLFLRELTNRQGQ